MAVETVRTRHPKVGATIRVERPFSLDPVARTDGIAARRLVERRRLTDMEYRTRAIGGEAQDHAERQAVGKQA